MHTDLHEKGLLTKEQFELLYAIEKKTVVSVFYELRTVLYLGILLFTIGLGFLIYEHIGDLGHIIAMLLITFAIAICGFYIYKKALPYSNKEVIVPHIYFDYVLILGALLVITLFTYVQVYFDLLAIFLPWTSRISAVFFLLVAFRYDNRAILNMALTALAAALGLAISPVNWLSGEWELGSNVYFTGLFLGFVYFGIGEVLKHFKIKEHFRFTFQNLGLLLIYASCMVLLVDSDLDVGMGFVLFIVAGLLAVYTWKTKDFLFFIYSCVSAYVGITFLLVTLLDEIDDLGFLLFYIPFSLIGFVVFLVSKQKHFAND